LTLTPAGAVVIVCHGVVSKVLLLSRFATHTAADWLKIGLAKNLSVSELVPDVDAWVAARTAYRSAAGYRV